MKDRSPAHRPWAARVLQPAFGEGEPALGVRAPVALLNPVRAGGQRQHHGSGPTAQRGGFEVAFEATLHPQREPANQPGPGGLQLCEHPEMAEQAGRVVEPLVLRRDP